jgi:hypothetical protein
MPAKNTTKKNFQATSYTIINQNKASVNCVVIEGQKLPPPSKRITLHQKNIKILNAKIIYKHKKGDIEFEVIRINHLKSFGEVRLHTNSILYPGTYLVTLEYIGEVDSKN